MITPSSTRDDRVSTTPSQVTPQQLGEAFMRFYQRIRRVSDERLSGTGGLSMPRIKLMQYLAMAGPTRQNVLATCFDVAPRSVTDMVDSLERDGLAQRQDDPTDRRAKLVALTPAGSAAAAICGQDRDRMFAHIFGALDEASRAQLIEHLATLEHATTTACEQSRRAEPDPLAALETLVHPERLPSRSNS
jgi:DNA-binding MarR family transcriptional regulator